MNPSTTSKAAAVVATTRDRIACKPHQRHEEIATKENMQKHTNDLTIHTYPQGCSTRNCTGKSGALKIRGTPASSFPSHQRQIWESVRCVWVQVHSLDLGQPRQSSSSCKLTLASYSSSWRVVLSFSSVCASSIFSTLFNFQAEVSS